LKHPRRLSGGHLREIANGAALHDDDERGADPSPAMRGVNPAGSVEEPVGFLLPRVRGGDDLSAGLRHDPCVRRRVEARAHPLVVYPLLVHVEFADLLEIACPADRDNGRDVIEVGAAHLIAGWKGRWHPPMVGQPRVGTRPSQLGKLCSQRPHTAVFALLTIRFA
jgi:hypothetical protein